MKILAVNRAINDTMATTPSIDIIADSAVIRDGKPFFVPNFADKWAFDACIAIRISRLGKNIGKKFASRYYDAIAPILRIKPKDINKTNNNGLYISFDGSIIMGEWLDCGINELNIKTSDQNHILHIEEMDIDNIIATLSSYITLKIGDVIILGHYSQNNGMEIDTSLTININGQECLKTKIK